MINFENLTVILRSSKNLLHKIKHLDTNMLQEYLFTICIIKFIQFVKHHVTYDCYN